MSNANDFPMMLYRAPGPHEIQGMMLAYVIVPDAEQLDAALDDGWCASPMDAHAEHTAAQEHAAEQRRAAANAEALARANASAPDAAPPTRAELEVKARELGISFTAKTTAAALVQAIDAKLRTAAA